MTSTSGSGESPPIVVQKYGGSSVADPGRIATVARLVKRRRDEGHRVCVVVSAMAETTDALLEQAKALHPAPPRRELDMLLSCGERASMALLAMALDQMGVPSISFTGSQSGIITNDAHADAQILEVRPYRVVDELRRDRVVIVAGFQGVSYKKEITTLGRGGSDTTAVALAAALDAVACEIYSDVDGVYSADPRVVDDAVRLDQLSYDQMQALARAGAKVLHEKAVAFARAKNIAVYARQTGGDSGGTVIRRDAPDHPAAVRAVASRGPLVHYRFDVTAAARVCDALSNAAVFEERDVGARIELLVDADDRGAPARAALARLCDQGVVTRIGEIAVVSAVGAGLDGRADLAAKMRVALDAASIEVLGGGRTAMHLTAWIPAGDKDRAVAAVHAALIRPSAAN